MSTFSSSVLVAIEGIDGAGKTTQVQMLRSAFENIGIFPVVSKEPTNGPWGQLIRDSASVGRLSPDAELEAFLNDRTEHVNTVIGPALAQGKVVILDRYFYSSIAYQGSRGASVQEVKAMMESRFPVPDAVVILDIDPVLSIHRIAYSRGEEPNHFEDRANLTKARAIFKTLSEPVIHHIDAANSRETIHGEIIHRLVDGALKTKWCAKHYGCDDLFHCGFRMTHECKWFQVAKTLRPVHEEIIAP